MSDFSCYVTIINDSPHELKLSVDASEGSWQGEIPATVPANATTPQLQLEDASGPHGSTGSLTLSIGSTGTWLRANFEDAYWGSNSAGMESGGLSPTMQWSFEGATNSDGGYIQGNLPPDGHPVYLRFTFKDSAGGEGAEAVEAEEG